METFELRYFAAVARHENVHRAAEELSISTGSLSKAVARLESELGVQLFERAHRNIRLTSFGRLLQRRAAEILRLEEATRTEIRGAEADFQVRIVGPEVILTRVAPDLIRKLRTEPGRASFEIEPAAEDDTLRRLLQGDAHLGLITSEAPAGLTARVLFKTAFVTCVGKGHPLYRAAKAGETLPIDEVLKHAFVCADRPILGQTQTVQAVDGWRDDKFPRRIGVVTRSLRLIEELVVGGDALAYLPDYYAAQMAATVVDISGCPYACKQTVRLVARDPEKVGWLHRLF
jgi:DNA-binding transcriptional LysR family regulator